MLAHLHSPQFAWCKQADKLTFIQNTEAATLSNHAKLIHHSAPGYVGENSQLLLYKNQGMINI